MRHRGRSAGIQWRQRDDSRAATEPRAQPQTGALPPSPAADLAALASFVPWLEQIALRLIRERASTDVLMCERLIAALKDLEERAVVESAGHSPRDDAFAASPMAQDVRYLIGGMRAVLRAVGSGDLPLGGELRAELSELVRDIVEVVMAVDLEGGGRRR